MADAELNALFSPHKPLESDILAELQSTMRLHGLSAEDLFFKWESYCIRMGIDAQAVSHDAVHGLKQSILDALENSRREVPPRTKRAKVTSTPRAGADVFGMIDGIAPRTPGTSATREGKKPAMPGRAPGANEKGQPGAAGSAATPVKSVFSERNNAGDVVEILNKHIPPVSAPSQPPAAPRIKLAAASDMKKMAFRPLALKLSEASESLDDRIDEFTALIQEHYDLDDEAFSSAARQSIEEIVAVGRVCSDSMQGHINVASLVLETSRRMGMGLRVPLNMEKIPHWSVFPGQIVALRGSNPTGDAFIVREMLEIPLLPNAASMPAALQAHRKRLQVDGPGAMEVEGELAPLSILFASGPYTADDNLDFEPLHALCSQAADSCADALVLTGPFIDTDHPLIATGDIKFPEDADYDPDTANMETVFRLLVAPAFHRLVASNPHISIVMVPSVRDVNNKHVCWPQDAMPRKDLGLPRSVRLVTNPMTMSMNEMLAGVSSQDILYELRIEELATKAAPGDLMSRLVRYVVEQRHYFPLFPSADPSKLPRTGTSSGVATGAMLDITYLKLGEMINVRPDVAVLPSALPPFVRVVDSVLAINPGYLSKRKGAGTYARMTLLAPRVDGEQADEVLAHKIYDRARVEIVRI